MLHDGADNERSISINARRQHKKQGKQGLVRDQGMEKFNQGQLGGGQPRNMSHAVAQVIAGSQNA